MESYTAIQMDDAGCTYDSFCGRTKEFADCMLKDWMKPGYVDKSVKHIQVFVNGVYRPELSIHF